VWTGEKLMSEGSGQAAADWGTAVLINALDNLRRKRVPRIGPLYTQKQTSQKRESMPAKGK
jgi:hypothetical protein